MEQARCFGDKNPVYAAYHDDEWGKPVHDDRTFFEFILLEGAQAGLSWETILMRRDGYREAFHDFDAQKVAEMSDETLENLLGFDGIIRNRLKVFGARKNAIAFLNIAEEFGSFDAYVWPFVGGKPIRNAWDKFEDVPVTIPESDALSKDLKKRGMTFVGSTIIYAFMQATGLVDDHLTTCPCYGKWHHLE